MADVKISQLPSATTPLGGSEEIPLVQSSTTKKVTVGGLFTSPTLVTPNLGTPSAVNLTNATNVPMAQATGTLPIANGGTNATTAGTARTNLGAAASGANSDITSMTGVTGGISSPDFVQFDTGATVTDATGRLYYNNDNQFQTLQFQMNGAQVQHIGQEQYYRVKLSAPATKGQVMMFTGSVGASGGLTAAPATGLLPEQANYILGIAAETGTTNDWVFVTAFGEVKGINTTGGAEAWTQGQELYYNPSVTGGLTKTKPTTPNAIAFIAAVVHVGTSNGILFIRPTFGSVLGGTDGNVQFGSLSNGDVIVYDSGDQRWENRAQSTLSVGTATTATNVSGVVAIVNGGTGQTTATAAINALLPSQTSNTGKYLTTDGTNTSWATVSSGAGTVTSVDVSGGTTGLTSSGGPVTTSGTITLAGTLNVTNGGTGATTLTGYVKGNGTSAMTASSTIPGSDVSGNISGNAANVTGTVAVANGGTGQTTYTDGQLLIGNSATGGLTKATLTAGTNVSIVNGNGTITIAATGGSGGGDVSGPASATNNAVVLFDGTTGKLIKDSTQTIASTNTASTVVARDGSGNFSAGTITAALSGNATTATTLQTARTINGTSFDGSANITITANTPNALTAGSYLTSGGTFDGSAARTFAVDATDANTASKVVARDVSGNFSAGTITANLSGNATTATTANAVANALTAGSYLTSGGTFNGSAARTFAVDATDANTASKVVARDASGNFSAGTITATGLSDSGNLAFTGTGNRITGDFSNATVANRVAFQTSTANTFTAVGIITNGTGNYSEVSVLNSSDPANASIGYLAANGSTDIRLVSTLRGTGTYLPMTFFTAGSERVRIDTSGNVGVGTSSGSTFGKFAVSGADDAALLGLASTTGVLRARAYNTATTGAVIEATNAAQSAYANMFVNGLNLLLGTGNTERMRITSAGDVGIGTSSPGYKLDLQGGRSVLSANSEQYALGLRYNAATNGVWLGSPSANAFAVYGFGGGEYMRIDSSGNLLVGTTSAAGARLNVNGDVQQRGTNGRITQAVKGIASTVSSITVDVGGGLDGTSYFVEISLSGYQGVYLRYIHTVYKTNSWTDFSPSVVQNLASSGVSVAYSSPSAGVLRYTITASVTYPVVQVEVTSGGTTADSATTISIS